ncbi:peptidoglycan amidohydrolase family protein [Enterococcus sp. LJL99]
MPDINKMIQWMTARQGKVTYSMSSRLGPTSYDCSSAVYFALIAGGFLPPGKMGNTDSLFNDLEANGWSKVPLTNGGYKVKRGDVFIWGTRGASGGSFGHTGIFLNENDQMIHCNYGYNGITVNDHDTIWAYNGKPPVTVYRYTGQLSGDGSSSNQTNTNNGQSTVVTPKGKWIAESATFTCTVDEIIFRGETADKTPNSPINLNSLGKIKNGQKVKYDAYMLDTNGWVWIRQPRANNKYAYLPTGTTANGKRNGPLWGTFK